MHSDPKELIKGAFDMARRAGKPDWQRMTSAVLKNRILLLTRGQFSEAEYGARSFTEFLNLAGDLVHVDHSRFPPLVEIAGQSPPRTATPEGRIRSDLWRAVVDYSSGRKYLWDSERNLAREAEDSDDLRFELPSLTKEDVARLRSDFAERTGGSLDAISRDRLAAWVKKALPTQFLPVALRPQWNGIIKGFVEDRVRRWFDEHELTPPPDLVERRPVERPVLRSSAQEVRELVLECVRAMTLRELLGLQLPVSALLRTRNPESDAD